MIIFFSILGYRHNDHFEGHFNKAHYVECQTKEQRKERKAKFKSIHPTYTESGCHGKIMNFAFNQFNKLGDCHIIRVPDRLNEVS